MGGPSIDSTMLWPLLVLALAYKGYYIWVLLVRMRAELTANKVRILRLKQAHGG
jgi:heme exporter protein C